jgi:predicted DNA-binding antitoxin AbrB/MazE fold protein
VQEFGAIVIETTTIRARFANGVLQPLEDVRLHEGEEVVLRIEPLSGPTSTDWIEETAGGWKGLVDADELKRRIKQSRLVVTGPEPRL